MYEKSNQPEKAKESLQRLAVLETNNAKKEQTIRRIGEVDRNCRWPAPSTTELPFDMLERRSEYAKKTTASLIAYAKARAAAEQQYSEALQLALSKLDAEPAFVFEGLDAALQSEKEFISDESERRAQFGQWLHESASAEEQYAVSQFQILGDLCAKRRMLRRQAGVSQAKATKACNILQNNWVKKSVCVLNKMICSSR